MSNTATYLEQAHAALRKQGIDINANQKWQSAYDSDFSATPRLIVEVYRHRAGDAEMLANVTGRFETAHDGLQHMAYHLTK